MRHDRRLDTGGQQPQVSPSAAGTGRLADDGDAVALQVALTHWPEDGEAMIVVYCAKSEDGARLAGQWGLARWGADSDVIEVPALTDVYVQISLSAVSVHAAGTFQGRAPIADKWSSGPRCTLVVISVPDSDRVDPNADFAAACRLGHVYIGDAQAVGDGKA